MGKSRVSAVEALTRFMYAMGQFHGYAHENIRDYKKFLRKLNPHAATWLNDFKDIFSKIKSLLRALNIPLIDDLQREIEHVLKTCREPNAFTTLMHGDICPDNVCDDPDYNAMYIIDFEWSFVGNALLDGTYLRMSNPTCWCVKAVPEDVIESLESVYRQELMKKIPAVIDDKIYYDSYVSACAYWMLLQVSSLEDILERESDINENSFPLHPKWRLEYNFRRPRALHRFQTFTEISRKHGQLSNLRYMTEQILKELEVCWSDVKPLELYPAFL